MTKIIRKELEAISEIGRENVLRSRVWLIEIKLAEKPIKFTAKIGCSSAILAKAIEVNIRGNRKWGNRDKVQLFFYKAWFWRKVREQVETSKGSKRGIFFFCKRKRITCANTLIEKMGGERETERQGMWERGREMKERKKKSCHTQKYRGKM